LLVAAAVAVQFTLAQLGLVVVRAVIELLQSQLLVTYQ
jgi:hypothetical protein